MRATSGSDQSLQGCEMRFGLRLLLHCLDGVEGEVVMDLDIWMIVR